LVLDDAGACLTIAYKFDYTTIWREGAAFLLGLKVGISTSRY